MKKKKISSLVPQDEVYPANKLGVRENGLGSYNPKLLSKTYFGTSVRITVDDKGFSSFIVLRITIYNHNGQKPNIIIAQARYTGSSFSGGQYSKLEPSLNNITISRDGNLTHFDISGSSSSHFFVEQLATPTLLGFTVTGI